MSHSCFIDSAFTVIADKLLTFAVNLHRRKFPANERVHIASVFSMTLLRYQQHLSFRNIQQKVCLSDVHSIIACFSLGLHRIRRRPRSRQPN